MLASPASYLESCGSFSNRLICGNLLSEATYLCPGSKAGVTYRQIKWEIHRWFTEMSDFEKLTFKCASPVYCVPSPTQWVAYSKTEMKINEKRIAALKDWSWESSTEGDLEDLSKSSINWPSISSVCVCVCDCSVDFYFMFLLILKALWRRVRVITGPGKWKLCALIFPLAGKPKSFPFQMFSIVACCLHLLDPRISQSLSYLSKPLCQSRAFQTWVRQLFFSVSLKVMIITHFPFRQ